MLVDMEVNAWILEFVEAEDGDLLTVLKKLNKENIQGLCVIGDCFKCFLNTDMKKIKIIVKSLVLYWEKF